MLLGDLNRHISNTVVKENHDKVSVGGKLLVEFLQNDRYVLVNATDKLSGGIFTRYDKSDPSNDSKKSLLDLIIVSKNLMKYVDRLEVDNMLQWTPFRVLKDQKKYSDHYALHLVLKSIPIRQQPFVHNKKTYYMEHQEENGLGKLQNENGKQ